MKHQTFVFSLLFFCFSVNCGWCKGFGHNRIAFSYFSCAFWAIRDHYNLNNHKHVSIKQQKTYTYTYTYKSI
uniref:Secreted protein n=1 Tax=Glossina morsitans morsitans TaxID=37546 RepID=A0A1B0GG23_GLOMM